MAVDSTLTSALMENLGKMRFDADTYKESDIRARAMETAGLLMSRLPDNYPDTLLGMQGVLARVMAEEFERLYKSQSDIAVDRFLKDMRPEMLYQNMGSLLTLGSKSVGTIGADGSSLLSDVEYRSFLTKVNTAYLGGSRKDNIERSLNDILGVPVVVKELSMEARKPGSSYGIKDTHRLLCDIDMEAQTPGNQVSNLVQDIDFYTDIIRPSHKLWETRLVWKDLLAVSGGCSPAVFGVNYNGNAPRLVTTPNAVDTYYLSSMKVGAVVPTGWTSGTISGINGVTGVITLVGGDEIVVSTGTTYYTTDSQGEYRIEFSDLVIGNVVAYLGMLSPGTPLFLSTPSYITANPYTAFNPDYYLLPSFQENVEKQMDANERFELVDRNCDDAMVDRVVSDVLQPQYEDMRGDCAYPGTMPIASYFTAIDGQVDYTLGNTPVLGASGELAELADLSVYLNGVLVPDSVFALNVITGLVILDFAATAGDVVEISYFYSRRFPLPTEYSTVWDYAIPAGDPDNLPATLEANPVDSMVQHLWWPSTPNKPSDTYQDVQVNKYPMLSALGTLAVPSDVKVYVDSVEQVGAIVSMQPLMGHIRLSFTPPLGSTLSVAYYYQGKPRAYSLALDDPEGTFDAHYGNSFPYSLVMDQPDSIDPLSSVQSYTALMEVGYRYRAYNLSATAVLNSSDTLTTNMTDSSGARASLAATYGLTNEQNQLYSPEYLYDTSRSVILNDDYLVNGMDPLLKLHVGTPTFQQTFTDRGEYAASFTGSWDTQSGLVEYAPLANFRDSARLRFYSDLRMEKTTTGTDVPLSIICDGSDISIGIRQSEEYFPYREMRLNDYMDYISRVSLYELIPAVNPGDPSDFSYLKGVYGSDIVKSVNRNWNQVPMGGIITMGGHSYTVLRRLNEETLQIHATLSLPSGKYNYVLGTDIAPQVRVSLNDVTRRVLVDTSTGAPHSQDSSELGNTWGVEVVFPDPTPGPYPRNLGNSNYPTPTPPLLDDEIHSDSGEVDLLLSTTEADLLVKWRNWDQLVIVVSELLDPAVNAGDYPTARIRLDSAPGPGTYQLWQVDVKQVTDTGYVVVSTQLELFR